MEFLVGSPLAISRLYQEGLKKKKKGVLRGHSLKNRIKYRNQKNHIFENTVGDISLRNIRFFIVLGLSMKEFSGF